MYSLNYWNERAMEWRGTGVTSDDREYVRKRQFEYVEQSGGCVRFRVLHVPS